MNEEIENVNLSANVCVRKMPDDVQRSRPVMTAAQRRKTENRVSHEHWPPWNGMWDSAGRGGAFSMRANGKSGPGGAKMETTEDRTRVLCSKPHMT
jgi:hypothetical protein